MKRHAPARPGKSFTSLFISIQPPVTTTYRIYEVVGKRMNVRLRDNIICKSSRIGAESQTHMSGQSSSPPERRSFLTHLNAGVASLAAIALGSAAMAQEKPAATTRWEPARHTKDDWLDEQPAKHRLVFDTTTPDG